MNIRAAGLKDRQNLLRLYNELMETDRYSSRANDSFQKVVAGADNFVFVAEEDSRLVGFITASARLVIRYPRPILQLDELYVAADFRKHGLGTKLIEAVEAVAGEKNYSRVYVESGFKHSPAHGFYEKGGYTKSGYYFLKVLN